MKYEDRVYGNHMEFTDKDSVKKRTKALISDKNNVVYVACVYRRRWKDIKEFKDFKYNPTEGSWIITMTATPQFHKRFLKFLNDWKTIKRFYKRFDWWVKRYHRMAKKYGEKREDADAEENAEHSTAKA